MANLVLSIDIGGTKTAIGVVNPTTGEVVNREKFPTEKSSPDALTHQLLAAITPYLKDVSAIGIAIAGQTDPQNGILIKAPNLPKTFENLHLTKYLEEKTGLKTTIDNDAHCFTLAEAHFGQGKGKKLILGVTLGTGIGGGITLNGELLKTSNNTSAELGHTSLNPNPGSTPEKQPQCSCGEYGHLEAYASGKAMTLAYNEKTGETIDAIELEQRALGKSGTKEQQKIALEISNAAADALGLGLASATELLNPDCIILGGGLLRMPIYIEAAKKSFAKHVAFKQLSQTPILDAALGDNAQLIGAAMLTL